MGRFVIRKQDCSLNGTDLLSGCRSGADNQDNASKDE